jgi:hypothetical protein
MDNLLFRGLVFLSLAATAAFALGQKHPVYPTVPPPPHTPQEILLLFSGNTADERILLTLNNNRPNVLTTSIPCTRLQVFRPRLRTSIWFHKRAG